MKYTEFYNGINAMLKMFSENEIHPLNNCNDDLTQIEHLLECYKNRYLEKCPEWNKFKDRPEMIPEMIIQSILGEINILKNKSPNNKGLVAPSRD